MSTPSLYQELGGAPALRDLVAAYLSELDTNPQLRPLRALYPQSLAHYRERMVEFLSGWLGGPPLYLQRHGLPMLRERHVSLAIGAAERDHWLACMSAALNRTVPDAGLRERLEAAFWRLADSMREGDHATPSQGAH